MIADSEKNAIRYWDIDAQQIKVLWENDDTDGSDGLLDQPCEVMVLKESSFFGLRSRDKLLVVNFDFTFPGLKNSVNDKFHTISIIDL